MKKEMSYASYLFHPVRTVLASPLGVIVPAGLTIVGCMSRYHNIPNIELSSWLFGSALTIFVIFLFLWGVPSSIFKSMTSWAKKPEGRLVIFDNGEIGTIVSASYGDPNGGIIYGVMIDGSVHDCRRKQFEFVEEK